MTRESGPELLHTNTTLELGPEQVANIQLLIDHWKEAHDQLRQAARMVSNITAKDLIHERAFTVISHVSTVNRFFAGFEHNAIVNIQVAKGSKRDESQDELDIQSSYGGVLTFRDLSQILNKAFDTSDISSLRAVDTLLFQLRNQKKGFPIHISAHQATKS
jgi:hypothetical protein